MALSRTSLPSGAIHKRQMWDAIGMWAWLLHRITGIGLVFYILLHTILMGSALISGKERFDATLSVLMGVPVFKLLDMLLLGAVLYHGLNGIRILLFDVGVGISIRSQKTIFWVLMAVGAVLWIWSMAHKLN